MIRLFLRTRIRRIVALIAFAILFIAAGATARALTGSEHGHVEVGDLYLIGGYPLVSTLLLLGWLLGRFPLIAVLALAAGIVSDDRASGLTRLYVVRGTPLISLYGRRLGVVLLVAFTLSALLLPAFDLIMLGTWAGSATLVLIASYVAVYGALCFLLSVWFRNEVWLALGLALVAMLWHALLRADKLAGAPPGIREVATVLLPPQGPLFQLESAFGSIQPVPWSAFVYVMIYAVMLIVAGLASLRLREY